MDTKAVILPNILQKVFFWAEYYQAEENDEDNMETYGLNHLNSLMYEALKKEAEEFTGKYKFEIWQILEIEDINSYLAENEVYEIYANGLESWISFKDKNVQNFFESIKYQV